MSKSCFNEKEADGSTAFSGILDSVQVGDGASSQEVLLLPNGTSNFDDDPITAVPSLGFIKNPNSGIAYTSDSATHSRMLLVAGGICVADAVVDTGGPDYLFSVRETFYPAKTTVSGDGTEALPAYSFAEDTDCGVYRIGANNLGISCGGTKKIDISTTALALGVPLTIDSASTLLTTLTSNGSGNDNEIRVWCKNADSTNGKAGIKLAGKDDGTDPDTCWYI